LSEILQKGNAMRVIFFYPGEEGTYVDDVEVVLYASGIVQIEKGKAERTTTHISNCEILWFFESGPEDGNKVRKLKVIDKPTPQPAGTPNFGLA
jgi:hypothetical protein